MKVGAWLVGAGVVACGFVAACGESPSSLASSDAGDAATADDDGLWTRGDAGERGDAAFTKIPHLDELGLPTVAPPVMDDVPCRAAPTLDCDGAERTGVVPAIFGGCLSGLLFELRDGGAVICEYERSDVPDAGALPSAGFAWTCVGPVPLGTPYVFLREYSTLQVSASGTFHVRFDAAADAAVDAGTTTFVVGGCFDTSSGHARCASPDTPIATPYGERAIDDLSVGDLVYSNDGDGWVVVPIARTVRVPVAGHRVVRLTLDDGRVVAMSSMHPDAEGRTFGALAPGDRLGERSVVHAEIVAYAFPYTVDIRPASRRGSYLAAGALVGSTLPASESRLVGRSE